MEAMVAEVQAVILHTVVRVLAQHPIRLIIPHLAIHQQVTAIKALEHTQARPILMLLPLIGE